MGLCALWGSLIPLLTQNFDQVLTPGGLAIIGGIAICVAGVGVCGYAGILRERSQAGDSSPASEKPDKMGKGLWICILSGIFSACCNLAFSYGDSIQVIAESEFGNVPWLATLAVWMLVFIGGFLASGSYAIYLLFKNDSWGKFAGPRTAGNLLWATLMALLHFAGLFLYGMGAHSLGRLGTSVGWAVSMSSALLVANLMGFLTAEWRSSNRRSRQWICAGLATLLAGIVVLGVGNSLRQ